MTNEAENSPEETPAERSYTISEGQADVAAAQENAAMQSNTIKYLNSRVVTLRAMVNLLTEQAENFRQELEELKAQLPPEEDEPEEG